MLKEFEVVVVQKNAKAEDILRSFFEVTGNTEGEERFIKRDLGRWKSVTGKAFRLLEKHHPELVKIFEQNNPMKHVRRKAA